MNEFVTREKCDRGLKFVKIHLNVGNLLYVSHCPSIHHNGFCSLWKMYTPYIPKTKLTNKAQCCKKKGVFYYFNKFHALLKIF